jgi:hypothetical protein
MDTFATVVVVLAMIALGALAIQLFTTNHDDRIAPLPSGRSRPPGKGPRRVAGARTVPGGLRQLRPWRRTRK